MFDVQHRINYIVDNKGEKTHVVISIDDFHNYFSYTINNETFFNQVESRTYPDYHINNILKFIKENDGLDVESWQSAYKQFFKYYSKLEMKDLMALHLFRTGILGKIIEKNGVMEYEHKEISTKSVTFLHNKDGSQLSYEVLSEIKDAVRKNSEQEFLKIFNRKVAFSEGLISAYKSDFKRLRRKSELNRMFIYDLDKLYVSGECEIDAEYEHFFSSDIDISLSNLRGIIFEYIAKYLYNGNISQVYRAAKEGEDRVNDIRI